MKTKTKNKTDNAIRRLKTGMPLQTSLKAGIFECFNCLGQGKSLYECRSACK